MPRIYLDACMVIDLVEGNPRQQVLLVQYLAAALQSDCEEFLTNDLRLAHAASGQIKVVDWDTLQAM